MTNIYSDPQFVEYMEAACKNMEDETVPGFLLKSINFCLTFVAGFHEGEASHILEYETDWMEVMVIILEALEDNPESVSDVEDAIVKSLEDWLSSDEEVQNVGITFTVNLEENQFFGLPLGIKKILRIKFTHDGFNTEVIFHVKKSPILKPKTLGELCATVAMDTVEEKDVAALGVPAILEGKLKKACKDNWTPRYHKLVVRDSVSSKK